MSTVSLATKWARLLIPEALSLQYCNLSRENDLKAATLQRRAEFAERESRSKLQYQKLEGGMRNSWSSMNVYAGQVK